MSKGKVKTSVKRIKEIQCIRYFDNSYRVDIPYRRKALKDYLIYLHKLMGYSFTDGQPEDWTPLHVCYNDRYDMCYCLYTDLKVLEFFNNEEHLVKEYGVRFVPIE